jgi:predicted dehydrogenase
VNKKRWGTHHIETPDRSDDSIRRKLRRGQYGQCVYQADNTVNDHQVVNMLYRSGATAAFSMEAMTSYGGRRTRIMGTKGDIVGDERYLDVATFNDEKRIRWDVEATGQDLSGHGGGDQRMTADWAQAVVRNDPSFLVTKLEDAMESHRVGYAAVTSSKEGGRLVTL